MQVLPSTQIGHKTTYTDMISDAKKIFSWYSDGTIIFYRIIFFSRKIHVDLRQKKCQEKKCGKKKIIK